MTITAGRNTVVITVTAEGTTTTAKYVVDVNVGVTDPFGWKASDDLDGLIAAGNDVPAGIWSNGATMWVIDDDDDKIYAYNSDGSRDASKDFDTLSAAGNVYPTDIWSDGATMWVADGGNSKLYAYNLNTKARDDSKDFDTLSAAGNELPTGIWSNGAAMWVADYNDAKLYAYNLDTKARHPSQDFITLTAARSDGPVGVWGDSATMWVASSDEAKVYSFNMAPSRDATLGTLTVSPKDIIGFASDRTSYQVGVASTVSWVTVEANANANDAGARFVITPDDTHSTTGGHQVTLSAGRNTVTITVTAADSSTKKYTVNVNQGVTDPFGWKAADDFDGLIAAQNETAVGIWSNGATMWVADDDEKLYAYQLSDGSRDSSKDFDTLSAAGNADPNGIWSNGTTMWVVDYIDAKIYAYRMSDKARDDSKDFDTLIAAQNNLSFGIRSNGATMWVADDNDGKLYAYRMSDKQRDESKDFNTLVGAGNNNPRGIWSNDTTMWVADYFDEKIYAYRMSDKTRDASKDFNTLVGMGNTEPIGIWSDGATMWVADFFDDKLYAYNRAPPNPPATLSALTLRPKDIIGFASDRTSYEVGVASTVTQVTVAATANDAGGRSVILPGDPDGGTAGHQVNLSAGRNTVTITVEAEDTTTQDYTVNVNRGVTVHFGWKAADDFDGLIAAQNEHPFGIWSDGATMWASDLTDVKIYAYNSDGTHDASKDFNTLVGAGNGVPSGIWSDDATMWVADVTNDKLYAYNLDTKARDAGKDFDTLSAAGNTNPSGIWSNGATMWVADRSDDKLYAYRMSDKERDESKDFNTLSAAGNTDPRGIWSNGATMWVADSGDAKLYAYRMSDKGRDAARKDFNTLVGAGNNGPVGIWSNGATMWVADEGDDKLYSYNMPPPEGYAPYGSPIHARLYVGQDWVRYKVDTHTLPCRQCLVGHAFVVNLENNRVYLVEVDTDLDSKDPRLKNAQVMDFEGWNLHNGTMRQDRWWDGSKFNLTGGQTNTIVNTRNWAIGGGDFFAYTQGNNGYDEATEEYRIRVRDVTGGSFRAASGTVRGTSGTVRGTSGTVRGTSGTVRGTSGTVRGTSGTVRGTSGTVRGTSGTVRAVEEPEPLAAVFAPPLPDSHGGSAFTMWLGFTEEVRITEKTLRAALSVSGGQLTGVAQRDAGYNRNWNVTITPNEFQTVTINMPATSDCGAANAICTQGGKRLSEALTLSVPHYTIPRVTGATVDGGPGDNGAWDTDETATFAVQFNKAVTVSGLHDNEPTLGILVGGTRREAEFTGGSGSDTLTFSHRVTSDDAGTTNIEVVDNGIALDETGIADSHSQAAVLTFDYYTYLSTTAPPIRALFRSLPASHGESGFTFELAFSEEPTGLSYLTLRGNDENPGVLSVANGEVDAVRRLESGGSRRWEITITPSGADPVTITLPANGDCTATDAICKNARPLAAPVTATVAAQAAPGNTTATGQPTISGTAQVGQTLTANVSGIADADGLDNANFAYEWMADYSDIAGATDSTYTLTPDDLGKRVKVLVTFTDDAGNAESLTSAKTAVVAATSPAAPENFAASVTNSGDLNLSWEAPTWDLSGEIRGEPTWGDGGSPITGYVVQWKEAPDSWDTEADVSEATVTGTAHTIQGLTSGTEYTTRVIAVNSVGRGAPSDEAAVTANRLPTGTPTISGTAQVGQTLTADVSGIADADGLSNVAYGYQWLAADAEIAGATSSTYTLQASDNGKTIRVKVSFTDDSGNSESLTSVATADVETPLTAEIRNVPESHNGQNAFTFRILFSEPVTVGYQGLKEDSFEISNGTITRARRVNGRNDLRQFTVRPSSNLDVVIVLPADRPCDDEGAICTSDGKRLSNRLELTVPGPAPANAPATGAPTISGTAQVGQTLTATTSNIADSDGLVNAVYGYQWVRNDGGTDAEIQGAMGSTYTLDAADEGKTVKVRVSFTDDAGNEETLTSEATEAVQPKANSPATGQPTISGTAQVGETLTADTSGIADEDGLDNASFAYEWMADDSDIAGATDSTYTLTPDDLGKSVKVKVSFTDAAGNAESLTSAATDEVEARPNSPATGQPTISGTAQVGETLTADTSGIADEDGLDNASFAYQWMADDSAIAGATDSTYTLTPDDLGKSVKVKVSFTDDRSTQETLTSAATSAVAAAPVPLTVSLENAATTHDGTGFFTFEIRFSEHIADLSYITLKDDAFTVTGGQVTKARRMDPHSDTRNVRWEITVVPDSNGDVTIVLPVTTNCDDQGAICTEDGRKLTNSLNFTVSGPGQ